MQPQLTGHSKGKSKLCQAKRSEQTKLSCVKHHYNPQVYLRQFRNPGTKDELWEYSTTDGSVRQTSPKAAGYEDYYHSFTLPDGTRDDETIEKSFNVLENKLPNLFESLRGKRSLSPTDFKTFINFIALQRARSPVALESIRDGMSRVHQMSFEIMKSRPPFQKAMLERGLDLEEVAKMDIQVKATRDPILLTMLEVWAEGSLQKLFAGMQWAFLVAPSELHFVTSDNPLCCWPPEGRKRIQRHIGPSDPRVEITFPLSRRTCAFGVWQGLPENGYPAATIAQVKAVNIRTVLNSWRYVYGPTLDNSIKELVEVRASKATRETDSSH